MAINNFGFAGKMSEASQARQFDIAGIDGVASATDWAVAAGSGRAVTIAPGKAFAAGILSENDASISLALPTPTNGQWFLIVRRIDWTVSPRVVTVEYVAGATTSTASPAAVPSTLPAVNTTPASKYDHILAWAWVNSTNTNVLVVDMRRRSLRLPQGGTAAERDAYYGVPASPAAQRRLQDSGATWFRVENGLRWEEIYVSAENAGTTFGGASRAGWYPMPGTGVMPSGRFVRNAAALDIPDATTTRIGNTLGFDPELRGGVTLPAADVFKVPVSGTYELDAQIHYNSQSGTVRDMGVTRNFTGSPGATTPLANVLAWERRPNTNSARVFRRVDLDAGDEIRFYTYHNVGAAGGITTKTSDQWVGSNNYLAARYVDLPNSL